VQRLVQGEHVEPRPLDGRQRLVQRHPGPLPAVDPGLAPPGVVDQHPPHRGRRGGVQVAAAGGRPPRPPAAGARGGGGGPWAREGGGRGPPAGHPPPARGGAWAEGGAGSRPGAPSSPPWTCRSRTVRSWDRTSLIAPPGFFGKTSEVVTRHSRTPLGGGEVCV